MSARSSHRLRVLTRSAAGFASVLACANAWAAPPKGGGDAAAAQALFYESRTLMHEGKYSVACPKLEESLRLDYGIGTEFNLADCNEKQGKLASAWSGFVNVAATARTQGQPQREKVARERAAALEPRLPKMTVNVASPAPDMEVRRDGVVVGAAAWATPVPVDPGPHQITATAPGRTKWAGTVTAVEGQALAVEIPALPSLPVAAAPAVAAPGAPPPEAAQPPPTTFPEPVVEHNNTQRVLGWVATALGIGALGVGAGFGIDSLVQRDNARAHCTGNLCDAEGLAMRERAITAGNVSTITTIAGAVALTGGVVLIVTAPKHGEQKEAPPVASLYAAPRVADSGAGLAIGGVFR